MHSDSAAAAKLEIATSWRTAQEMAKQGITPVTMAGFVVRILLIAMFFSVDCVYVVKELEKRRDLRRFAHIVDLPSVDTIYRFLSRFNEAQFVSFISGMLNSLSINGRREGTGRSWWTGT
jgi:hypothetical protein